MSQTNRRVVLAAYPEGMPTEEHFRIEDSDVPEPGDGEVRVRTRYTSVDPYLRGLLRPGPGAYMDTVDVGQVVPGGSVGVVDASRHADYREGDTVVGLWGWQDYGILPGDQLHRFDPSLGPLSLALGILGMPGMTAYFGVLDVGALRPECDAVFVSGAAGAVGSAVGQIARIKGCRVAGSAGSEAKIRFLREECGFDAAFNYKEADDLGAALDAVCPQGIDLYFDNVGGPITDAVFPRLARGGRVAVCGQISQYNATEPPVGPRLLWHLIVKRARAEGFLVFDFQDRYAEAQQQMATWIQEGKLRYRETVKEGLEQTPAAFIGLFTGENIGKMVVKVSGD